VGVRTRYLGLFGILIVLWMPSSAQAQGDFIKDKVKELIEKSGIYISGSTRTSIDDQVDMGRSLGIGYGTAGSKKTGWKYPFSFGGYRGDLQTEGGLDFGRIRARQIMTGIGYQWVHGKMVYGVQLGVGYSFNQVTISPDAPVVFSTTPPVRVDVSNSWVVRPLVKAEYFVHPKLSVRTQLSYTYTDPNVVVTTATSRFTDEWRPTHMQLSVALGVFPFRK
jgi:hypothetical protein